LWWKNERYMNEYVRISFVTLGAILQGTAMALFLFPHNIPSGGAAGLALLLNFWTKLPLGFSLWLVNFVLLILAINYFGYFWTFRTMYSVTITSVTIHLLETYVHFSHIHLLLDLILGALIFGYGVGLLIKNRASSGGMVIPALMIANYQRTPPGRPMFWLNLFIFLLTATIINYQIVIFAILCQWVSTRVIDRVNRYA
jgi:uncharacterized membrane-anchored protein YitT (DUF2179 family)